MKNILSALLILSFGILYAQDYRVIKVDGDIVYKKNDNPLQKGSSFKAGEQFLFKSKNARAAVILAGKGRFILQPDNSDLAFAKANLAPAMSNMSSRSGALVNRVDLENYFSGNYVILNKVKLKISSTIFPMNDNQFFYVSYMYRGERIDKLLSHEDDILVLDKKELLKIDGKAIDGSEVSEMKLKYMNRKENNGRVTISAFTPVFPNMKQLKEEVQIVLDGFSKSSKEDKIKEVLMFINDFYGKYDKEDVVSWLKSEFKF